MVDARATDHHAKLYLIDDKIAIIASSNLTGRGLLERIEAGNVVTERQEVIALVQEFENYFNTDHNIPQKILLALLKWLQFASPWDICLKICGLLRMFNPSRFVIKKSLFPIRLI
jgi:phosphatidylserine/phosphatidylglycerophosphate/cardiolipin synthase-like enzyme